MNEYTYSENGTTVKIAKNELYVSIETPSGSYFLQGDEATELISAIQTHFDLSGNITFEKAVLDHTRGWGF